MNKFPVLVDIVIYEDNKDLALGLKLLLNTAEDFNIKGTFENCDNIAQDIERLEPQVVLMDIEMPGIGGIEGLRRAKALSGNKIKVLMLTVFENNEKIFESLKHGADGYILKKTSPVKIIEYVRDALDGGAPMTPSVARKVLESFSNTKKSANDQLLDSLSEREKDVLNLIVEGHSYKMIADSLFISVDTVRSHIKKIYEKLHVNSKSQAVAVALKKR